MNMTWLRLPFVVWAGVLFLLGCQTRPAVPTIPPEPTDAVIVVVVTATSQPTFAVTETAEATITPIPTLTPLPDKTIAATLAAGTPTPPGATRAATVVPTAAPTDGEPPTRAATPAETSAAPTALPSSFAAPTAIAPEGIAFRDGDALRLQFTSSGRLAPDECYRFDITLAHPSGPGAVSDYWVGLCGNQSNVGDRLLFEIKQGRFRNDPNYGSLLIAADSVIPPTPHYEMRWTATVVKLIDASDPIHPKVQPLSASSPALPNTFFR